MYQEFKCSICNDPIRGHGGRLPELYSYHLKAKHPEQYKRLGQIRNKMDRLEHESKALGVYLRDIFWYRN